MARKALSMKGVDPESLDSVMSLAQDYRLTPETFAMRCSGGRWKNYKHLQFVCDKVAETVYRGDGRLIVNMPPRHGKSESLSYWTPLWQLSRQPASRIITATHTAELAANYGRRARDECKLNPLIGVSLKENSNAADRWDTPQGGGMKTAGVGSALAGWGAHLVIVDDPYPGWDEAHSPAYRRKLINWWESVLYYRLEPNATIIVLHHRFHTDDLTGYLLGKTNEEWEHISLPAIAEEGVADPIGRRPGEALCPERYTAKRLNIIAASEETPLRWEAMYQQRPRRTGAGAAYPNFSDLNVTPDAVLGPGDLTLAFDFNINPGCHCYVGQYNSVVDRFRWTDEIFEHRGSIQRIMQLFKEWWESEDRRDIEDIIVFGDSTGRAESEVTSEACYDIIFNALNDIVGRERWRDHVPTKNPPVPGRVMTVNEALRDAKGEVHVEIHPRCKRLINDFDRVRLDENGSIDKSDSTLTHSTDAVGYQVWSQRPIYNVEIPEGVFN